MYKPLKVYNEKVMIKICLKNYGINFFFTILNFKNFLK